MSIKIQLSQGLAAIIDESDYPDVARFKWTVSRKNGKPYAVRRVHLGPISKYVYAGKMVYLHSHLMSPAQGQVVDHINGNTLDCRRSNMRVCSSAENSRNRGRGKNNTSGYKGVAYTPKTGRWRAHIMVNRKGIHLGYFSTPAEAARAYDAAATKFFGEFANLNFPARAVHK